MKARFGSVQTREGSLEAVDRALRRFSEMRVNGSVTVHFSEGSVTRLEYRHFQPIASAEDEPGCI